MNRAVLSILLTPLLFLLLLMPASALETGSTAPDFELPNLNGEKIKLSDFRGQVIVLKLATTWCPTCKQQRESIKEAEPFLKENDVAVVEVFLQDSADMIRKHMAGAELALPNAVLLDNGSAARAYHVYVIPRVVVIDREFKIQRDGSLITAHDLTRRIKRILGDG